MSDSIFRRAATAVRAAVGVFSDDGQRRTWDLLSGVLPGGLGMPPQRYTRDFLRAYSQMPWLRAAANKIAMSCAMVEWKLYRTGAPDKPATRNLKVQRAPMEVRKQVLKELSSTKDLVEIVDHPLLTVLHDANSFQTGLQMRKVTQLHIDLVGEAFWLKERDALGTVIGVWPIPPDWILNTPTPTNRFFRVGFRAWKGMIPDTEFLWFQDTDPSNPYARGSGVGQSIGDELETDEYTAKHTKAFFYNRAKPDLLIYPKTGNVRQADITRLENDWMQSNQGFWRAFKPYFMTREVGVHEMDQNFRAMQLVQLREFERDVIIQTFGIPPETLGILTHSNRATIDAASYLMGRFVLQPRLEFMRTVLQEKFVPEFDERLVIDYASPVEEDAAAKQSAATAAPWALTINEWRQLAGQDPLKTADGDLHMIQAGYTPSKLADAVTRAEEQHTADTAPPPAPVIAPGAGARGPMPRPKPRKPGKSVYRLATRESLAAFGPGDVFTDDNATLAMDSLAALARARTRAGLVCVRIHVPETVLCQPISDGIVELPPGLTYRIDSRVDDVCEVSVDVAEESPEPVVVHVHNHVAAATPDVHVAPPRLLRRRIERDVHGQAIGLIEESTEER